ncbi:cytochrome P450 [Daedaleopsis nitida]|nr:cytochrome P450 [Daedaleopsis nitida]
MPRPDNSSWALALPLLVIFVVVRLHRRASEHRIRSRGLPLPPGPAPLPLIGNLLDIPKLYPWKTYREYGRRYGKIISLKVMGRCLVIINDADAALELLEKRSAIYSSRAHSVTIELCGWGDWNMASLPYGERWRSHRKTFWQHFHPGVISKYRPLQEEGARRLLPRLLLSPDSNQLVNDIRYSLGEVLIRAAYGLKIAETDDKYIETFEEAVGSLELLVTGTSILEFLPFLARVPTWLPGTSLLRRMAYYRELTTRIREDPWADAKDAIMAGRASDSVASAVFEDLSQSQRDDAAMKEVTIKNVLALTYAAGVDTSHSTLSALFVAMVLYPDVQRKAQAELDAVVGESRLPELTDRDKLPYLNAVIKELLRWHIVLPLSLPHLNISDDEYDGYYIPKDSVVMVNVWSILQDEEEYPQPERFIPERFLLNGKLRSDIRDPATMAFGFGRRICPGRYFAEETLFIYIASILHTLDITPPLDERGQPMQVEARASNGLVSRQEDCRCTIKPRSAAAEALIHCIDSSQRVDA